MNFYVNSSSYGSSMEGVGVWMIVALVLALVGCFVVYFLFCLPEKKYNNKFVNWLRDFLNFKKLSLEMILKIAYLFASIYITLGSFGFIGVNFLTFILSLTVGNLILRIVFESALMMIMIWKNTNDINKKLK